MRNYILIWGSFFQMIDNTGTVQPGLFYTLAGTQDEMIAEQDALIQAVIDGSGGFLTGAQINFAGKQYVPMDKEIIIRLLQYTGINENFFPAELITTFDWGSVLTNETFWNKPKLWPTSDGGRGKRGSFTLPPDFSGFLNGLLTLAASLQAKKLYNKAGAVLFAYRQIVSGAWSVTQALDYLEKLHIF
jgi:hypothetical protein